MTDTVKHMWDQVEKARADGTFSSDHAAVPAQGAKEQIAAQVLLAMSDKADADLYGVSYALKLNKARAERAADSILSLHSPAACESEEIRQLRIDNARLRDEKAIAEIAAKPLYSRRKLEEENAQLRAQVEEKNLHLSYCREAMRFADIDLSMILPDVANLEVRRSIRKTLDRIDEARKLSHSSTVSQSMEAGK